MFRNLGGAKFEAFTGEAGLTALPPSRHRGSAVADLNGDGRLDVVVSSLSAPAEIWINDSTGSGHWLDFALEGRATAMASEPESRSQPAAPRSITTSHSRLAMPRPAPFPRTSDSERPNPLTWSRFMGRRESFRSSEMFRAIASHRWKSRRS